MSEPEISFEAVLWRRLDAIDERLRSIETRVAVMETKALLFGAAIAFVVSAGVATISRIIR